MRRDEKEAERVREEEANYFARCLLMPEDLVKKEADRMKRIGNSECRALAKLFGVETLMMAFRLGELHGARQKKKK